MSSTIRQIIVEPCRQWAFPLAHKAEHSNDYWAI